MGIRLIAYNILSGGEGRADPIAEVLLGQRPDIVGLHETTDPASLRRIAGGLRMPFVVADSRGGSVALLSRFSILDSVNVAALHDATTPMLDATLDVAGRPLLVRVAHLTGRLEAERMAGVLAGRVPHAMLVSYDAPLGLRVVDGVVGPSAPGTLPGATMPVRQIDQVLLRPDVRATETWAEQDRLAFYASDHLPGGAEVDLA